MHRGVVASIVGAGLSIGFGGVASAADLAPAPAPIYTKAAAPIPYSWTGFYAGEQAGYGWSADDVNMAGTPISFDPIGGAGALAVMNASAGAAGLDFNTRPKGFLAGGTLGYNLQTGVFVLGVETDLSWADIKGTATAARTAPIVGFTPLVVTAIGTAEQKMDAFGTLRARLGVLPTDKLLIYETGGVAYGHVESNTNIGEAIPTVPVISLANTIGSASAWRVGWTAGAGLEYAFAPHWTAKAEYLYYDLGSISYSSTMVSTVPGSPVFTSVGVNSSADFKGNIVRGGINYKFW